MGTYHKIASDVKADIIRRIKEEGVSVAQAAEEHGIHKSTIFNWLGGDTKGSPTWSEFAKLKREKDELLRIVGALTVQHSIAQKKSW